MLLVHRKLRLRVPQPLLKLQLLYHVQSVRVLWHSESWGENCCTPSCSANFVSHLLLAQLSVFLLQLLLQAPYGRSNLRAVISNTAVDF